VLEYVVFVTNDRYTSWPSLLEFQCWQEQLCAPGGHAAMTENTISNHERSLKSLISEIRDEVRDFLATRLHIIQSEFQETLAAAKVAVPISLIGMMFVSAGFLMLTFAAAAVIASAFSGNPYAWFFGFLVVGCLWVILGAIAFFFAYNEFRGRGRFPKRTVEVLKADKAWLQSEARSTL
jgi:hypothetical protein